MLYSLGPRPANHCQLLHDTRSARSAMNFFTSMFILLTIDTYSDNCQLSGTSSVVLSIAHFRPTCKNGIMCMNNARERE